MRRIAVELPLAILAACLVASLVFAAGNAIAPSTAPVVLAYTPQPVLCTPSYCGPPEAPLAEAGSPEPQMDATNTAVEAR